MKIWIAFKASSDEDQFDLAMTNMEVVGCGQMNWPKRIASLDFEHYLIGGKT